jgi:hypothetical protein
MTPQLSRGTPLNDFCLSGPVARARGLAPSIAAVADEIERIRRITEPLLGELHKARLFRMLSPRDLHYETIGQVLLGNPPQMFCSVCRESLPATAGRPAPAGRPATPTMSSAAIRAARSRPRRCGPLSAAAAATGCCPRSSKSDAPSALGRARYGNGRQHRRDVSQLATRLPARPATAPVLGSKLRVADMRF